jgi:hypothetical protein
VKRIINKAEEHGWEVKKLAMIWMGVQHATRHLWIPSL